MLLVQISVSYIVIVSWLYVLLYANLFQRRSKTKRKKSEKGKRTGLRVFLISVDSEPPLRAMISGAASGSWAMGEPHSSQNQRQTALPESAVPFHFLTGPLTSSLSLRTTATRAVSYVSIFVLISQSGRHDECEGRKGGSGSYEGSGYVPGVGNSSGHSPWSSSWSYQIGTAGTNGSPVLQLQNNDVDSC